MKADKFDQKFDSGEDITPYLDMNTIRRPGYEQRRVNVDFPTWIIEALDREAARVGVTRRMFECKLTHRRITLWIGYSTDL